MITVVIGHRGAGKSELLKRLQKYRAQEDVEFIDLDHEIEAQTGHSISEIFLVQGEPYFRELEKQKFREIVERARGDIFVAVGAGFAVSEIPSHAFVLWVRRRTDSNGRIFLDRPRLNSQMNPLDEYHQRALAREQIFQQRADEIYLMPEGSFVDRHHAMLIEKKILNHHIKEVGGVMTIPRNAMASNLRWSEFKNRYGKRGISYFEIRDDDFSVVEATKILREMPFEKFIYSFRREFSEDFRWSQEGLREVMAAASWVDWAWELGPPAKVLEQVPRNRIILSLHDQNQFSSWMNYESKVAHLKYAPFVESFSDLQRGHEWQLSQSAGRSFLPRSTASQWDWYRLQRKGQQMINFWREGEGSAADQPSLWSWLMTPETPKVFAAVLGDPVDHSFTPLEHSDFFYERSCPVYAIRVGREEWDLALPFLQTLGLKYAAVTAPHKEVAAKLCRDKDLKAVNTLYWSEQEWRGTSTDYEGFLKLIESGKMAALHQSEIFVWGGGGTFEMMRKALPDGTYFSSRTGRRRDGGEPSSVDEPKALIWAAPRTDETQFPPLSWRPKVVCDLNYREDSMGREYAQRCGAQYESGLVMFQIQAERQRAFWIHCEERK